MEEVAGFFILTKESAMGKSERIIVLIAAFIMISPVFSIAGLINLPQTGQVTCYNTSGTVIPCAGTGQDGDIRAGVPWPLPRFVDNLDGTITDELTGLMWLQDANCFFPVYLGSYWQDVLTVLADFNLHPENYSCKNYPTSPAPFSDWRVPNIIELESLFNEEADSTVWLINQGFKNVQYAAWSSTSWVHAPGISAWSDRFQYQYLLPQPKDSYFSLMPVRGGQHGTPDPTYLANLWRTGQDLCYDNSDPGSPINCAGTGQDGETRMGITWPDPRFTDNSDGTVTDNLTGLMWLKAINCFEGKAWQQALDTVKGFNAQPGDYSCVGYTAMYSDWRLPNRTELMSLTDFSQDYPALPPGYSTFFPDAGIWSSYCWSSTSCAPGGYGPQEAWLYSFYGSIQHEPKTSRGCVWPVRGGPTGSANFSDLSVAKTADTDPVATGQQLTYTVTVSNYGPDQAQGVVLTDILPKGTTFVSANPGQGSCAQAQGTVTCDIGGIASSVQVVVTIVVLAPDQSGTLTNKASVSCTSIDLYPQNNSTAIDTMAKGPVNLPRTGQATRFYTGDDGDIWAGVVWPGPRFTIVYCDVSGPCSNQGSDCDSNASTDMVMDNLTGLTWARSGNIANLDHGSSWLYPIQYIQNTLNPGNGICGHKDWRVPNINELLSLSNVSPWLNSQGFVSVQDSYYWSSTTQPYDTSTALAARYGAVFPVLKSDFWYHYFIPVRGGTTPPAQVWRTGQVTSYAAGDDGSVKAGVPWPSPRFANPNGTTPVTGNVVLDKLTGLMWTKNANLPGDLTWTAGIDYVASMNTGAGYGGYKDWRFPNRIELYSLLDLSEGNPALQSGHPFSNVGSLYWSSTTDPGDSSQAYSVGFVMQIAGVVGFNSKAVDARGVWPVRGGKVGKKSSIKVDFDGDGKTDVLWQYTGGTVAMWLMNGASVSSVGVPGSASTDWQIRGAGDFDGDAKTDVLWQHVPSGTVALWLMDGSAILSVGVPGSAGSNWQIKGVGDFDGDGKADILWQESATGTVAIWFMNGTAIASTGVSGAVGSDWQIKGVGDFDGSGKTSILWQHTPTGTAAVWIMNGTTITTVGIPGAAGPEWQIMGVGDFDGNTKADILWQHTPTGTVAIWFMDGTSIASTGVSGAVASNWQIKGVGDFDGDGKADILWQETATGTVAVWLLDGAAITTVGVSGAAGSEWQIVH
jgi:uncharacterized repeat protein (TIGR01451 family)